MKKIIAFSITLTLLLIGINIIPSTISNSGNTIYVDDEPGEGPGNPPEDYTDIQDAINAAEEGDIIFVYKGAYSKFNANKGVTIIGEDRNETIVKGNKIRITGDGVTVSNFTLKGKSAPEDWTLLVLTGDYSTFSHCNLYPKDGNYPLYGIEFEWCKYTTIYDCIIQGFAYDGIQCDSAKYCSIANCSISNCKKGIHFLSPDLKYVYVYNCEFFNNDEYGIYMEWEPRHVYICNCDFYDNPTGLKLYTGWNNQISSCKFYNNNIGCLLIPYSEWYGSSPVKENLIVANIFKDNNIGINLKHSGSKDNDVHHNNFINNSNYNAADTGTNNEWDDGNEGNYWDDYTGEDNNGDGLGDTPYTILSNGIDNYPFMNPLSMENQPPYDTMIEGPTSCVQWVRYIYYTYAKDPNYDLRFYQLKAGDGLNSGWFGPFANFNGSVEYIWENSGTYWIKAKSKDVKGSESSWSDTLQVHITPNNRPKKPNVTGSSENIVGYPIELSAISTDDDGDQLEYLFEWGDGKTSGWKGPYNSGETITCSHIYGDWYSFKSNHTFTIKIKVRDIHGAESETTYYELLVVNHRPETPTILEVNQINLWKLQIIFVSDDIDNHKLFYQIHTGFSKEFNTEVYESGEPYIFEYSYRPFGTYNFRVKAIDYYGASSSWEKYEIKMRWKTPLITYILQLLEKLINLLT